MDCTGTGKLAVIAFEETAVTFPTTRLEAIDPDTAQARAAQQTTNLIDTRIVTTPLAAI
ncbi:MAG: hypothetical protein GX141_05545 [Armatimonadetes bacterium]|nr:hypothetical protein [Armatimonadota bacterium]